jgi:transposase-like protein
MAHSQKRTVAARAIGWLLPGKPQMASGKVGASRCRGACYEASRCWSLKFAPLVARRFKKRRCVPSPRWRLDEMVCWNGSKRMHLWWAVDDEGQVLDPVVRRRRNTEAAQRLLKRLLQNQPVEPLKIMSDGLASYGAALPQLDPPHLHRPAGGEQPERELISADPTMRTTTAAVQVAGPSPKIRHHPRGDLQHLQQPATFDQQARPSALPSRSEGGLGRRPLPEFTQSRANLGLPRLTWQLLQMASVGSSPPPESGKQTSKWEAGIATSS